MNISPVYRRYIFKLLFMYWKLDYLFQFYHSLNDTFQHSRDIEICNHFKDGPESIWGNVEHLCILQGHLAFHTQHPNWPIQSGSKTFEVYSLFFFRSSMDHLNLHRSYPYLNSNWFMFYDESTLKFIHQVKLKILQSSYKIFYTFFSSSTHIVGF